MLPTAAKGLDGRSKKFYTAYLTFAVDASLGRS